MREEFRNPITKAVHEMVEGICSQKTGLNITEAESDSCLAITIYPHANDARYLVGKSGRTIKALEFLAERAGEVANKKCFLGLEDSFEGKVFPDEPRPRINPDFDFEKLKRMLTAWNVLLFWDAPGIEFRRDNGEIKIYLTPKKEDAGFVTVVRALDSLFFQYGISNGCTVKIRPPMNGD